MRTLLQDLRYGLRMLAKNPGFTVVEVLILALGIGAATAIFSVVYGVLLRPLPYTKSEQIVRLSELTPSGLQMNFDDPNFEDVRSQTRSLKGLAEYHANLQSVSGGSEPIRTIVASVSRDFFSVMAVQPVLGRGFRGEDQRVGAEPVALISYNCWKQILGGTRELAAAHLRIAQQPFSVVGVLPPRFRFPEDADIWVPRELSPPLPSRTAHNWRVVGRLRDGVALSASRSELSAIADQLKSQYGSTLDLAGISAEPMREALTGYVRPALMLLLAASGLLLLIGCANVVNLLLAQAAAREKELAIRSALGAERGRLVRQFFTEALLLALISSGLGIMTAAWAVRALLQTAPKTLPRAEDVSMNVVVLLFSVGITLFVALGLGVFSALRASANAGNALNESSQRYAGSLRGRRLGRLLVASQLATTLALLAGAGLLGRSLLRVLSIDPGFRTERIVTMDLELANALDQAAKVSRAQFLTEFMARLREIPGVEEVGGTSALPLATGTSSDGSYATLNPQQISLHTQDLISRSAKESLESQPALMKEISDFFDVIFRDQTNTGEADYAVASEGYFKALRIPLIRGRLFDDRDSFGSPHVAIISNSLAKEKWPKGDALGHTIEFGNMDGDLRLLTVVGVVGDVRERSVEAPPRPTIYVNYRQRPQTTTHFTIILQTGGDIHSVTSAAREILHGLDPNVPPSFSTFPQIFSAAFETRRFSLTLAAIFGGAALLLAMAGIYGVTAYSVARRTREIGVRIALGATRREVLLMILGDGAVTTTIGIAIGIVGSLFVTRAMQSVLFAVSADDPLTFVAITALLIFVTLAACFIPARRATQVDPLVALRYE